MSTSAKTLTPEQQNALAKFQAYVRQRAASTSQTQGIASLNTQPNPLLQNIQSSIGTYIDPIEGKDYTDILAPYLAKQLTDRGITDFGQVEKKVIPGVAGRYEGDPEAGQYFIPGTPDVTKYYNKNTGQEITNQILLDDKAGTKYILTDQGVQKDFDPIQKLAVQLSPYVDPSSSGGAWGTKAGGSSGPGFGPEGFLRKMAENFINQTGLTDLNKLGVRTTTEYHEAGNMVYVPVSVTTYYNKDTGEKVNFNGTLGGYGEGPGWTNTSLTFKGNRPVVKTTGEDTNWFADKGPLMTALKFTPIGPVVAAIDAIQSYYNYGDPTKAILAAIPHTGVLDSIAGTAANVAGSAGELASNSGIAGLAQNLGVSADLANTIGKVGAQSLLSGTLSATQGKGFLPGAKSGVVSGLVNEGVNVGVNAVAPDAFKGLGSLEAPAKSLATSALTAKALGRPFDLGQAVEGAAINYGLNQAGQAAGVDPKQQAALMKFYNFAAPIIAARRKPGGR